MKIKKTYELVNPFGGFHFAFKSMRRQRLDVDIDNVFGKRVKQAKYSYSDAILGWIFSMFCGAEWLEDTQRLRGRVRNFSLPSSDRLAFIFKQFAVEDEIIVSRYNTVHHFNTHSKLNNLMVDVAIKLGMIRGRAPNTLDYDNTVIYTKKHDATISYKKVLGYQPGVSFIGTIPVYIEGRGGNSVATYKICDTLVKTLNLLGDKGVRVSKFRSDSAAFGMETMNEMNSRGIDYFIRARKDGGIRQIVKEDAKWRKAIVSGGELLVRSKRYFMSDEDHEIRLVIYKAESWVGYKKSNDEVTDVVRIIATNNFDMSEEEIIKFYNQRGAIERNFDVLKNDFNWRRLPFSFLKYNTVFMIISAIGWIMYQWLIRDYSKKVDWIKPNFRLKNFIYHFIMVSVRWVDDDTLEMFTDRDYGPLLE